jgi:hypothetical protein
MNDKLLYRIPEVAEHLSISRSASRPLSGSGYRSATDHLSRHRH